MEAHSARKFLVAAGIVASLFFADAADAAQRNRESPGWNFFDLFRRDRVRKRSDFGDYRNSKRRNNRDNDFVTKPVKRHVKKVTTPVKRHVKNVTKPVKKKAKPKRYAGPVQVIEEKPEPPLIYQPEKLEALRAANLVEAAPTEPLAAAVHEELKGRGSAIRVTADERQVLVDFYRLNGFRPVWVSKQGLGERGRSVMRLMQASAEDGLSPEDYLPPSLARFDDDLTLIDNDMIRLGRLDLELSARALRYARHVSGGRVVPNKLTIYNDITPETVDLAAAMKVFLRSTAPADYLKSLQPQHPAYAVFKRALAELRELAAEPGSSMIRPGRRVAPGESDSRIAQVRRHLALLGYVKADALPGEEATLDEGLSERLKTFQADARIKPTGMLDTATVGALNSRNGNESIARLTYNMERLRWLPKTLGRRHVFANQAAYTLMVVDDGREVWRTNVIVGKSTTQTVAFSDKMETIVFNPSWGVPPSIMKNKMLPRLRRDPGYLDRIGYRVLALDGKIVRSRSVPWWQYKDKVPYLIQQPPGDDNAMGEVKFLFPNAHSIYFHDTPNRSLFKRATRALSYGCVRVENPRLFAEVLLDLEDSDIAALIDTGISQASRVTRETAVHLTYFTAWPAADGRIVYYDDIYGRDERMERAFTSVAVASR